MDCHVLVESVLPREGELSARVSVMTEGAMVEAGAVAPSDARWRARHLPLTGEDGLRCDHTDAPKCVRSASRIAPTAALCGPGLDSITRSASA